MTPGQFRDLPDAEQEEILAYAREVCPSCGNLRAVCSNPDQLWYPQRAMCYATAARDQVQRKLAKKYKQPEYNDPTPHETDGMGIYVTPEDLTPDDDFV